MRVGDGIADNYPNKNYFWAWKIIDITIMQNLIVFLYQCAGNQRHCNGQTIVKKRAESHGRKQPKKHQQRQSRRRYTETGSADRKPDPGKGQRYPHQIPLSPPRHQGQAWIRHCGPGKNHSAGSPMKLSSKNRLMSMHLRLFPADITPKNRLLVGAPNLSVRRVPWHRHGHRIAASHLCGSGHPAEMDSARQGIWPSFKPHQRPGHPPEKRSCCLGSADAGFLSFVPERSANAKLW